MAGGLDGLALDGATGRAGRGERPSPAEPVEALVEPVEALVEPVEASGPSCPRRNLSGAQVKTFRVEKPRHDPTRAK